MYFERAERSKTNDELESDCRKIILWLRRLHNTLTPDWTIINADDSMPYALTALSDAS